MIAMLDTSEDLDVCEQEIGCPVEQLLTPLTRFTRQAPEMPFAIDNGCFKRFLEAEFLSLLEREKPTRHLCRFVTCPDIVASARRTLEVFERWMSRRELHGWPLALVAQDGLEDLEIPWDSIKAVFIGGSTDWKMGKHAADVIRAALMLGKWVHVGRVNTPERWEHFEELGVSSVDGSGIARYSWMRIRIRDRAKHPTLFDDIPDEGMAEAAADESRDAAILSGDFNEVNA